MADQDNQRIQKLAPDGRLLAKWGSGLLDEGQMAPGAFDDPSGNVLVADRDQFRVAFFSPTGEPLRRISRPLAQGALYAMDVALDPSGNVWVLTDGQGMVKFSPGGDVLATVFDSLRGEDRPAYDALGIVAEAGGSVLVADTQVGRILRFGEVDGCRAALVGRSSRCVCRRARSVPLAAGRRSRRGQGPR